MQPNETDPRQADDAVPAAEPDDDEWTEARLTEIAEKQEVIDRMEQQHALAHKALVNTVNQASVVLETILKRLDKIEARLLAVERAGNARRQGLN
jgi:hypothetical protein